MAAPQLHTIETILDDHSLPLLVQKRTGGRLLLHKSVRLPYVICQTLGTSQTDEDFFLIPLNDKGKLLCTDVSYKGKLLCVICTLQR